jgi:hypothetical protein
MRRALALLALTSCMREPPGVEKQKPAPVEVPVEKVPVSKRRVVDRSDLESWAGLPPRAVFNVQMGLGSRGPVSRQVLVNFDTKQLEAHDYDFSVDAPPPRKRTLTDAELAKLRELVEAAWQAPPLPKEMVSDFREVAIATDGDDAMMISSQGPIGGNNAPAELVTELRRLAWGRGVH